MNLELLKNTSNNKITFLSDINHYVEKNKSGKFKYFINYNFDIKLIKEFIDTLNPFSLYVMIPLISKTGKLNDPYIILSKQILITEFSNYITVNEFLAEQLNTFLTDFELREIDNYFLIFKYKKISLTN
jgi:hypothetical protein